MFSGMSDHSVDSKGRIVLPSHFREELGESFYVARGLSKCVQVLSEEAFRHLSERIKQLPYKQATRLRYLTVGTAKLVTPNAQGRITIPAKLREIAAIENEAVVVGMDDHVEIWNKERFDSLLSIDDDEVESYMGSLMV